MNLNLIDEPDWWALWQFPLVRQAQLAECGHACLAMISKFHRGSVDLPQLRARFPPSNRGLNLAAIVSIADSIGLQGRPLKAEMNALHLVGLPAVAHWDMNHFVVISKISKRYIYIHDPAVGSRKITRIEAAKHFTGVILELRPTTKFATASGTTTRAPLRQVLGSIRGASSPFIQVMVLGAVLEGCAMIVPFLSQWVIDRAIFSNDFELLAAISMAFVFIVCLQACLATVRGYVISAVGATFNYQWMRNIYGHLLRLPIIYFEQRSLGGISSRFSGIFTIQRTLNAAFTEAIVDGAMAIGTLILLFIYSAKLASISIGAAAVYGGCRLLFASKLRALNHETLTHQSRQQSSFFESMRGIQTIRLFGKEVARTVVWSNLLVEQLNVDLKRQRLEQGGRTAAVFITGLERVAVIWFAASFVMDRTFTVGMFLAYIAYREQFSSKMVSLVDKVLELDTLKVYVERLSDITLTKPDPIVGLVDSTDVPRGGPSIEVRNVDVSIQGQQTILLRDVNMFIPAGACVAITGPSGAGKTTLARMLCGLLEHRTGSIFLDGIELGRNEAVRSKRRVATVMQDDTLFAGSIAENISFFAEDADREKIERVAVLASIHDDIMAMPMRYETFVGDLGVALSGGQRQRLFLARALYQDPAILLLDEATSNLDATSERAINEILLGLPLTRIIIAHRRETLELADYLYRVEKHHVELVRGELPSRSV